MIVGKKLIWRPLGLIMIGFLFLGCSTEFDVTANWKETTIVYGLLDENQEKQYIRVSKAFLDEETGALEFAGIPDSLHFDPEKTSVYLIETTDGGKVDSVLLEVDSTQSKEPGTFASPEQIVYRIDDPVDSDNTYTLVINTPLGNRITASTPVVEAPRLFRPFSFQEMNLSTNRAFDISFTVPANGVIHDLDIRVHYEDYRASDSTFIANKFVSWKVYSNQAYRSSTAVDHTISMRGMAITHEMGARIPVDPTVRRRILGLEWITTVGSEDLSNYIRVNSGSNSVVQVRAEYTNVIGGLGIFASRIQQPDLKALELTTDYPTNSPNFRQVALPEGLDSLNFYYPELNFIAR